MGFNVDKTVILLYIISCFLIFSRPY